MGFFFMWEKSKLAQQIEIIYNHPLQVRKAVGLIRSDLLLISNSVKVLIIESEKTSADFPLKQIKQLDSNAYIHFNILNARYLGPQTDIDSLKQSIIRLTLIQKRIILQAQQFRITNAEPFIADLKKEENQMNVVLEDLQKIYDFAESKSTELYADSIRISNLTTIHIILLIALILLFSSLISYILWRNIRTPLKELKKIVNSYKEGHYDVRSSYKLLNEFGDLSGNFNDIANAISINNDEKAKRTNELLLSNKQLAFHLSEIEQFALPPTTFRNRCVH